MYDLVLMDIQMPYMDGIDATRVIQEQWSHGPKIVVITALAFETYREVCLDAGADDFLTKPIKIEELKDAIERNIKVGELREYRWPL
jgi:CheY-like chemotaxis protein